MFSDYFSDKKNKSRIVSIAQALSELFNYPPTTTGICKEKSSNEIIRMCSNCASLTSTLYSTLIELTRTSNLYGAEESMTVTDNNTSNCNSAFTRIYSEPDYYVSHTSSLIGKFLNGLLLITSSPPSSTRTFINEITEYDDDDIDNHLIIKSEPETFENTKDQCFDNDDLTPTEIQAAPAPGGDEFSSSSSWPCLERCCSISTRHCRSFTPEDRQSIHSLFWTHLSDTNQRKAFVSNLVQYIPTKRKTTANQLKPSRREGSYIFHLYKLNESGVDGNIEIDEDKKVQVCAEMFKKTLEISKSQIHRWVSKKFSALIPKDSDRIKKRYNKKAVKKPLPRIVPLLDQDPLNSPLVLLRRSDRIPSSRVKKQPPQETMKESSMLTKYGCSQCSEEFQYQWAASIHSIVIHESLSPSQTCHLCGFKYYSSLHALNKSHDFGSHHCTTTDNNNKLGDGESYRCDFCGKVLLNKSGLEIHSWSHDNSAMRRFSCTHCSRSYTLQIYLNNHVKKCHTGTVQGSQTKTKQANAKFQCIYCGLLVCKTSINTHIDRHHREPEEHIYDCKVCGKRFARAAFLRLHAEKAHTGEKPNIQCSVCRAVVRKAYLPIHMKRVHKDLSLSM